MGTELEIIAYGINFAPVTSFKFLGRVLLEADTNWTEVDKNHQKEPQKWERLNRVLIREDVDAWTSGNIYLALVQLIKIYGLEMWVMTPHIGRVLGGFYHRVACRLTGRQPQRG